MGSDDRGASAVLKLHSEGHVMDNHRLVAPVDHKATGVATRLVHTGQMITVDGNVGTVRLKA